MPVFHILLLMKIIQQFFFKITSKLKNQTELAKSGLTMNNLRATVSSKGVEPLCIIIIILIFSISYWFFGIPKNVVKQC